MSVVNRVSADHARLLSRLSGLGSEPCGPQLEHVYDVIREKARRGSTMCDFVDFSLEDIEIIANDLGKHGYSVVILNGSRPKFSVCW